MSSLAMPSSSVAGFRSSSFSPSPSRKKLPATLAPLTGGIGGGYAPSSPRLQPVGVGKGPSSSTLVASSSSPTFGGTASSSPHRTKSSVKTGTSPHGLKGSNRPAGLSPSKIESGRRSGRSEAESATEISARSGGGGDKAGAQQHVDPAIGTQSIAGLRAQLRELTALLDLHTTDPTVAVDIWRTESQRDPYLRQRCALVDSGRTSLPDTVYDDARIAAEDEEKKGEVDEQKNIEVEVPLLTPTAAAKAAGSGGGGSGTGTAHLARQTSSGNASTTEGVSGQASPTAAGGPKRGSVFGGSLTVPGAGNGGSQTIGHSGRRSPSPTPSDGAQSKRSSIASNNGEASATSRERGAKRVAAKAKPRSSVRTASPGPKLQRDSASSKTPSETGKQTAPSSEALPAKAGGGSTQEAGSAGPEAVVEDVSPLASDSPPDAGASQVQEHSLMSLSSGPPVDPQAGSGRSLTNDSPHSATETLEKQLRLGRGLSLKVPSGERAAIAAPEPDATVDGNDGERRKDRRDSEVSHGASLHSGSPLVAPPPGARKLSSIAGASMTGGDHGGGLGSSVGSGRAMSHTSIKASSGAVASLLQPTTAGMSSHGQRSASPLESLRLIEEAKGGLSPRAKAVVQLMQSRNVDQSGSPNPLSTLSGGLNSSESSAAQQEGFAIPAPRTVGGGSKSGQRKGLAPLPIKKDTPVVPLSLQQQQSVSNGAGPGNALLNSQFSASQFGPQLATMGTFTGTGSPQLAPLHRGGTVPLPPDAQELADLEIELFELRGSVKQKKLECRKWRATMDRDKTDGTHPQAKYAEPIEDMQRKCILEQNALDAQLAALRAELREASEAVETQSAKIAMMSSHVERSGGDLDAALSTGGVATERDLKPLIAQAEAAVAQATDTLEQQRQYQKRYFDRTAATMDAMEDRLQSQRENALRADLIRRGLDPDEIMSKLQFFAPPKDLKDRDQQDGTGTQGAAVQDLSKGPSPVPQSLSLSHGHSPQGQSPQTQSPQARSPGGQMGKKTGSTPGPTPKHGKTSHVLSVSPTPKRGDPLQLSMERRSSLSTDGPPEEPDAEGFMAHDPHGEWMYQLERLQKEHDARVLRKKRREEEKKRREEERQAEREKKLHHHPAAAHPASHPPVSNTPHHHRDSGLPVSSSFHHLHSSVVLTPKNGKSPPLPAPIEEPKVPVVPTSQPILLESPSGKEMLHDIIADDIVATLHTEGKEREAIAEMYGQSLRILARKEVAANLKVQADEARRIAASKDPGMSFTGIGRSVAERHREHGTEFQFTKLGRRIDVDATEVTDEKGTLSKSMSFTTPAAQAAALAKNGGSVRKPQQQQQGGAKVSQAQAGAQSSTTSIKQAGASGRQPLPARAGGASPTKLIQSEPGSFIQSSSGSPTKQKAGQQGFHQQGLQQGKAGQQGQGPMSPTLSAQRRGSGVSTMSMSQAMSQASARSRGRGSNGSGVQGRGRGK